MTPSQTVILTAINKAKEAKNSTVSLLKMLNMDKNENQTNNVFDTVIEELNKIEERQEIMIDNLLSILALSVPNTYHFHCTKGDNSNEGLGCSHSDDRQSRTQKQEKNFQCHAQVQSLHQREAQNHTQSQTVHHEVKGRSFSYEVLLSACPLLELLDSLQKYNTKSTQEDK
ncbi:MAG: hypothetical protein KU29_12255 [Sulfurovum sp. FS06-10]|nr:MAG: hypothetical protein KU29_12255 [Sulfurovum sp. FS06-10]